MSEEFDAWEREIQQRNAVYEQRAKERRENFQASMLLFFAGISTMILAAYGFGGKNTDFFMYGGAGTAVVVLLLQRWFWALVLFLAFLTLVATALACIIHFMIVQAVAATLGAILAAGSLAIMIDRWPPI